MLLYDPKNGVFTWGCQTSNQGRVQAGRAAGVLNNCGYVLIGIDGGKYLAHRLAWLYMTGHWPQDEIDHKNGTRNDNRYANLREATSSLNRQNIHRAFSNNRLGVLGVRSLKGRFTAQISAGGKIRHLGSFTTPVEAHAAYLQAKRKLHKGCTL